MKKLSLFLSLILIFSINTISQNISEIDGVYYAESTSEPYSGIYTSYFDNGNAKMEVKFLNGFRNGETRIYFEDGALNEIRGYKEDMMHGSWVTYNDQKVKVGLANYKNGLKHGEWMIWDDKGNLLYEMNYVNGEKAGTWKKYDAHGNVVSERVF